VFTVTSAVGADIREDLASAVVKVLRLMELRPAHLSLEEIFLQLTTNDASMEEMDDQRVAVTTRELRSYFLSPLAYLVGAFFVFGSGLLFWLILQNNHEASVRGLISNVHVLFLFVIPMISMRLLAEEQRTGTMELLMTNPVQEWEIVTGKFLGSAFFVLCMLLATLLFPLFLFIFGSPDRGQS